MHELSISRSVVAMCAERAMGAQVKRVTLVVGKLSAVLPDSLRFCFDICAEGTPVEGALLEIIEEKMGWEAPEELSGPEPAPKKRKKAA